MKESEKNVERNALTNEDFNEFLTAEGDAQWKILLTHAEKNKKTIQIRRLKKMEDLEKYNDHAQEEISKQFEEFCHTKGFAAKFKVAFSNMAENARKQKAADKAQLEEVKRQSAEANPEFTEFLHTKGFKAKIKLIVANLKKGCKEASHKTAVAVDNISAQTKANIARAKANVHVSSAGYGTRQAAYTEEHNAEQEKYTADELTKAFNEFLKAKGLDGEYAVEITDEEEKAE